MASPRYLTPFAFLALLPLGGWLGGAWTFAGAAATVIFMPALDCTLGEQHRSDLPANPKTRWLPRLYVVAQLAVTVWIAVVVSKAVIRPLDAAGLTASMGVTAGVFGFVAAHELIHSTDSHDRALGITSLASVFYMHFEIAHLEGHHQRAATDEDPASARLGEGFYSFFLRSIGGQFREAWNYAAARQRTRNRPFPGLANRMVAYLAVEAILLFAVAALSWRALAFMLATATVAIALLEGFNYIAHYGLRRRIGPDGRAEELSVRHSWNSRRRMDNAGLFNMGCHSDHHRHPCRSFKQLHPLPDAAELPFGYGVALLTAFVPPLWRQTMDKHAMAAMAADWNNPDNQTHRSVRPRLS